MNLFASTFSKKDCNNNLFTFPSKPTSASTSFSGIFSKVTDIKPSVPLFPKPLESTQTKPIFNVPQTAMWKTSKQQKSFNPPKQEKSTFGNTSGYNFFGTKPNTVEKQKEIIPQPSGVSPFFATKNNDNKEQNKTNTFQLGNFTNVPQPSTNISNPFQNIAKSNTQNKETSQTKSLFNWNKQQTKKQVPNQLSPQQNIVKTDNVFNNWNTTVKDNPVTNNTRSFVCSQCYRINPNVNLNNNPNNSSRNLNNNVGLFNQQQQIVTPPVAVTPNFVNPFIITTKPNVSSLSQISPHQLFGGQQTIGTPQIQQNNSITQPQMSPYSQDMTQSLGMMILAFQIQQSLAYLQNKQEDKSQKKTYQKETDNKEQDQTQSLFTKYNPKKMSKYQQDNDDYYFSSNRFRNNSGNNSNYYDSRIIETQSLKSNYQYSYVENETNQNKKTDYEKYKNKNKYNDWSDDETRSEYSYRQNANPYYFNKNPNKQILIQNIQKLFYKPKKQQTTKQTKISPNQLPTCQNYTISPSINQLQKMTTKQLQSVNNFIVKNNEGQIRFLEPVNLLKVDIDDAIKIQSNSIDIKKQILKIKGEAIIKFFNFGGLGTIKDQTRKQKTINKIHKWVKKMNLQLIDLNTISGQITLKL